MTTIHTILPDTPRGYPLEPCGDWFEVIIPEATVNMFANPSFETTTNRTAAVGAGATVARSSNVARWGAWSLQVSPGATATGGGYLSVQLLTAGTTYTMSVYVYEPEGRSLRVVFYDEVAGVELAATTIRPPAARWVRAVVSATAVSTGIHDLRVLKNGSTSTTAFYLDGFQCEAKPYATTYCDGDQRGFVPTRQDYYWSGAAHTSTSARIAQCRHGGRPVKLSALGFRITALAGLGMAPADAAFLPTGFLGGASYQRSTYGQRRMSLIGDMRGDEIGFAQDQAALMAALRFDLTDPPQPVVLRYQRTNGSGIPTSEEAFIPCVLEQGPGNAFNNLYHEAVELRFQLDRLPTLQLWGERGAVLDYQDSSAACSYVMQRSPGGVWSTLGGGANGVIYDMAYGPEGELYIVGAFTTFGGAAHNRIVKIEPDGTVVAMAGGADGIIRGVVATLGVRVYVIGEFANLGSGGGSVAAARIGYYESGVWYAMGTGLNNTGYKLAIDRDGLPIAVGNFTTANGVTVNRVAKWTGATFSAYGTGADIGIGGVVYDVAVRDSDGWIFLSGNFAATGGGGTVLNDAAAWDATTGAWNTLGGGPAVGAYEAIAVAPNGEVYTGGRTSALQRWNGVQWLEVGDAPLDAVAITFEPSGMAWLGVQFAAPYTGLARWNGSTYIPPDITLPPGAPVADATVAAVAIGRDGTLTIGGYDAVGNSGFSGTVYMAGVTTILTPGDANSYPVVEMTGPGAPVALRNVTTGKEITFSGLTLIAGERATLILDPTLVRFSSNLRPQLEQHINRGSQEAEFYIQGRSLTNPTGINLIALYMAETTSAATSALIRFRPRYQSLQSLIYKATL